MVPILTPRPERAAMDLRRDWQETCADLASLQRRPFEMLRRGRRPSEFVLDSTSQDIGCGRFPMCDEGHPRGLRKFPSQRRSSSASACAESIGRFLTWARMAPAHIASPVDPGTHRPEGEDHRHPDDCCALNLASNAVPLQKPAVRCAGGVARPLLRFTVSLS